MFEGFQVDNLNVPASTPDEIRSLHPFRDKCHADSLRSEQMGTSPFAPRRSALCCTEPPAGFRLSANFFLARAA